MANGMMMTERRLAQLEEFQRRSDERWERNDRRIATLLKALEYQARKSDKRHAEAARRLDAHQRTLDAHQRTLDANQQTINEMLRAIRRLLEN